MKAKHYKLPSGLNIILVAIPDSPTTTVEVLVEAGSKYESPKEAGLSHFLEHMCFKGTEKRPSALTVSRAFDEIGAHSNAFTSSEVTGYWAKASSKQLLQVLDIVSDIYLNAIFKKENVEKEKGVVIEEINMYEDQPQAIVGEIFDMGMHGDQPAGLPIAGNKESVRSFTVKDLENYRKKHYVASATTIVVAGKFVEKEVLSQIKNLFAPISRGKKQSKKKTVIKPTGPKVISKKKSTDQLHLILGVRSFPYGDERNNALSILRGVLSSGASSRLFQKMREELGICYYVKAINMPSTDHGEFAVTSGVDPERVEVAVEALIQELKKLKVDLVPQDELKKVQTSMISGMYMHLETSESVADYFSSRWIFHKDLLPPEDKEKQILSVTAEDVRDVARLIFTDKNLLLAVVAKEVNEARFKKLLSFE
ncbi:MAG: pitrilysin family protein [Parcubacteria group bacterium]